MYPLQGKKPPAILTDFFLPYKSAAWLFTSRGACGGGRMSSSTHAGRGSMRATGLPGLPKVKCDFARSRPPRALRPLKVPRLSKDGVSGAPVPASLASPRPETIRNGSDPLPRIYYIVAARPLSKFQNAQPLRDRFVSA